MLIDRKFCNGSLSQLLFPHHPSRMSKAKRPPPILFRLVSPFVRRHSATRLQPLNNLVLFSLPCLTAARSVIHPSHFMLILFPSTGSSKQSKTGRQGRVRYLGRLAQPHESFSLIEKMLNLYVHLAPTHVKTRKAYLVAGRTEYIIPSSIRIVILLTT
ncbi:hypothetical protein B0H66DRAFT_83863 [Apodospora peruviana]|uniref:Uncharacterized protein n=1 Tax=Apodospora peruviana TaxID=516989 RepID=A0AAE0ITJ0_9PEZI|nr:hypothetical protein B0H66DRAFT_83863 [Apodospora peruviana]